MNSQNRRRTRYLRAVLVLLVSAVCLITYSPAYAEPITMTVVYDNTVYVPGTTADWGFGCMIEGIEHPILFDTGNYGNILLSNIAALGLDLSAVDDIALSHDHYDHTSGLDEVLAIHNQVNVYLGDSFPTSFEQMIINYGAIPIPVSDPVQICNLVHSTGEISGAPQEQALIIEAAEGLIVITGCAHPGIVQILQRAREVVPGNIYLVIGGFHLLNATAPQIQGIITSFQVLGVENVGPTHCTGDLAMQLFQQAYGVHCLTMGTGREIQVSSPVGVEPGAAVSAIPILDPASPNPFNPSTTVAYEVPAVGPVRLQVFDLRGRLVRTLIDESMDAGSHEVQWDGRGDDGRELPSAVFLLRLEAGGKVATGRMTLVR
jgi:7,8-dihydropterin-6-yl-methyl-4-(beta-D-ribofuranosyl)aminobenzene 5'-phosphate synthase